MNAKNYFCYPQSYMSLSQIKEFYVSLPKKKKDKGFFFPYPKKRRKVSCLNVHLWFESPFPYKKKRSF